ERIPRSPFPGGDRGARPSARAFSCEERRIPEAVRPLPVLREPLLLHPALELGRRLEAEVLADRGVVVGARRIGVEPEVVAERQPHEVIAPGAREQDREVLELVLVGASVVRVADVAAYADPEELAAKVVLEPGSRDLRAVEEILGADEADDRVED